MVVILRYKNLVHLFSLSYRTILRLKGKKKETGEKNHSWYNKESFMERNLKLFNPNDLKSNLDD
jgi:hypothetical protein